MAYAVYFEAGGDTRRLPVNPEEISRNRSMSCESYRVLGGEMVTLPTGPELETFSLEAEFPYEERHYTNGAFVDGDTFIRFFRRLQEKRKPVRFIASNDIGDEINETVLVTGLEISEKAGEEGDKYISLKLTKYRAPSKRFVKVADVQKPAEEAPKNPVTAENKSHTVVKGDTLWGIAKTYYGNGAQYPKIAAANPGIKNPNLIYPGQVLTIPG